MLYNLFIFRSTIFGLALYFYQWLLKFDSTMQLLFTKIYVQA